MKRFNVIIINNIPDDNALLSKLITNNYPLLEISCICSDVRSARELVKKQRPQLIILNAEMASTTGFDMLRVLPPNTFKVIFLAPDTTWVLHALRLNAVDYLLTPLNLEEFHLSIVRSLEHLEIFGIEAFSEKIDALLKSLPQRYEKPKIIALKNINGHHHIPLDTILYCSTTKVDSINGGINVRIQFRLITGECVSVSNSSINHFEEVLSPFEFARVSTPYIVNVQHIKIYHKKSSRLIMKPYYDIMERKTIEKEIYITDSRKRNFESLYNSFAINLL